MKKEFLIIYLRQRKKEFILFAVCCLIFLCIFWLYHLPAGAVFYPALLCLLLRLSLFLKDFSQAYKKHRTLLRMGELPAELMKDFPEISTAEDADYQQIIKELCRVQGEWKTQTDIRYLDMVDYYTVWAHQIKTPLASMRLNLQNEDSDLARRIMEDVFRVEQYVEMVLCYLRLGSDSTDYVIQEYDLDVIIKQAVKKFAGQFIRRKIRLIYQPVNICVVTDEKWLQFVLEQVISNALKYTRAGEIRIEAERTDKRGYNTENAPVTGEYIDLYIRDTGIGIAPEDLPRIFEKGYTGYNGRNDKKASGIGLYLCRRICRNLGHVITANSSPDSGTAIRIRFDGK